VVLGVVAVASANQVIWASTVPEAFVSSIEGVPLNVMQVLFLKQPTCKRCVQLTVKVSRSSRLPSSSAKKAAVFFSGW
jgi:hypothetical protein